MSDKIKIVISIGSGGNYFLRKGSEMIAGIKNLDDMEMFCELYKNKLESLGHSVEVFNAGFDHYSLVNAIDN